MKKSLMLGVVLSGIVGGVVYVYGGKVCRPDDCKTLHEIHEAVLQASRTIHSFRGVWWDNKPTPEVLEKLREELAQAKRLLIENGFIDLFPLLRDLETGRALTEENASSELYYELFNKGQRIVLYGNSIPARCWTRDEKKEG